tara:strand:+ start:478 stop:843 length:366 start_codon:yes stop_codon:yes gene_type:complete
MDMPKIEKKKKLQIERYLECRGEVRELERLLQESRLRYRREAKNIKRQTWGDWWREWKEWWTDKDEWISNEIKKNEEEMDLFQNLKKSVGLSDDNDCDYMQESYNKYINSNNYQDMEVDEI